MEEPGPPDEHTARAFLERPVPKALERPVAYEQRHLAPRLARLETAIAAKRAHHLFVGTEGGPPLEVVVPPAAQE
jgi:hypothetical protein